MVALVLSVAFSGAALIASLVGLNLQGDVNAEQRSINDDQERAIEDQIRANEEFRTDEAMQYAIRVAWWMNHNYQTLTVQNRSTVPIRDVTFRYKAVFEGDHLSDLPGTPLHDTSPVAYLWLIPPCTSVVIDVKTLTDMWGVGRPTDYGVYGIQMLTWERVDFIDVQGSWSVRSGERPEKLRVEKRLVFAEGDWPLPRTLLTEEPANDCGSG